MMTSPAIKHIEVKIVGSSLQNACVSFKNRIQASKSHRCFHLQVQTPETTLKSQLPVPAAPNVLKPVFKHLKDCFAALIFRHFDIWQSNEETQTADSLPWESSYQPCLRRNGTSRLFCRLCLASYACILPSHTRWTRHSRASIFSIMLLSSCSLVRFSNCHRLSICKISKATGKKLKVIAFHGRQLSVQQTHYLAQGKHVQSYLQNDFQQITTACADCPRESSTGWTRFQWNSPVNLSVLHQRSALISDANESPRGRWLWPCSQKQLYESTTRRPWPSFSSPAARGRFGTWFCFSLRLQAGGAQLLLGFSSQESKLGSALSVKAAVSK